MTKSIIISIAIFFLAACSTPVDPDPSFEISTPARPETTATPAPSSTLEPTASPLPSATPEPEPKRFTAVLLGADRDPRRPERQRFGNRTDVFMLVTWVDHWEKGITDVALLSVPRDLWIEVPCSPLDPSLNGYDRVNAAFTYGGFDCVRETVEINFGLEVNAPVFMVEMLPFVEVIDIFEPIIITPSQTYTDWCGDFQGTEGGRGGLVTWYEGRDYEMNGNYLLCYLRARARAETGDLDRNRRALEAVNAMVDQYPSQLISDPLAVVPELLGFWLRVDELIDSDIQASDIFAIAPVAYQALSGDVDWRSIRLTLNEVDFYTTPIYGASVLALEVDLYGWTDCMLNGGLECTSTHALETGGE